MTNKININLLFALACEAKPLIEYLKLKKVTSKPFTHYVGLLDKQLLIQQNKDNSNQAITINLVISGSGKIRMAAATAWLGALTSCDKAVWLNVGTAGHKQAPIGSMHRVHYVSDEITEQQLYPPMVAQWRGQSMAVTTVVAPTQNYPEKQAVEMEAYAFFSIAQRFTDAELVQALKVISDNAQTDIEQLDAKYVTQLMQPHSESIIGFVLSMLNLLSVQPVLTINDEWVEHLRCSVSQRHQYRELMRRLIALDVFNADNQPNFETHSSMRHLLVELQTKLDAVLPDLNQHCVQ